VGELAKSVISKWKRLVMTYSPPRVEEDLSVDCQDLTDIHSQESPDPDPDLFVADDGRPMAFLMSAKDKEAIKVRRDAKNVL
jgi:hypothetical protein